MLPLASLFHESARLYGDRLALDVDGVRHTYSELDERVNRLSNALVDLGVAKGDRVAVMEIDSAAHIETAYAIARTGAVYVPINYRLRTDEVRFLLTDTEPTVFLFGGDYAELAAVMPEAVQSLRHLVQLGPAPVGGGVLAHEALVQSGSPDDPGVNVGLDDILQIQFSSGTTGLPKGAVLTHRILCDRAAAGMAENPRAEGEVYFNAAPFFHVAGSQIDYVVHLRGGTVVRHAQFVAEAVAAVLVDKRVTAAFLVPSMINFLLRVDGIEQADFSALRSIEYGAAPMPPSLLREAMKVFGCDFTQLFGAGTEGGLQAILHADQHRLDESPAAATRLRSIGRPPLFNAVRVVNAEGDEVAPGEVGEIISRGGSVMREYWRRPEATAETVRDGWLHAGDMATVDEEGYLYLVDRKKDMIIRGGENIYPAEVEQVLSEHPAIFECAVFGVPDDVWGEAVKAVAVLREGLTATEDELIAHCRERMASYKKPASVDFSDGLPRNASGKVLKRDLRAPFWEAHDRSI